MKLPIKQINSHIDQICDAFDGKNDKMYDMRIGDAQNTLIILSALLNEDFYTALEVYNNTNWSPECQLPFAVINFLSKCQDIITHVDNGAKK